MCSDLIQLPNTYVFFRHLLPLEHFPRPLVIGVEHVTDKRYGNKGVERTDAPHVTFQYTIAGEGVFKDSSGTHRVTPGSGFLCNSHNPDIHYYYPQEGSETWSFIYFDFVAYDKMINELIKQSGHLFQMDGNAPIMRQLNAYLNSSHSTGKSRIELDLGEGMMMIASLLGELAGSFMNRRETAPQVQLLRISHKIIHAHMDQNLNVQQLAERLSVSPEHLSRVFRKELNTSPLKYMNKEKMNKACELCKTTTLSNKEIASMLGFANPNHFARSFRRVVGMSPKEYRNYGITPFI